MSDQTGNEPVDMGVALCRRATEKAILVEMANGDQVWIPQKAVHENSEVYQRNDNGKLIIFRWFARLKGWDLS